MTVESSAWKTHPLTPERWPDFEGLFGRSGASGGCWCMWFRWDRAEAKRATNAGSKQAMCELVDGGAVTGLILYAGDVPAGWVSLQPREAFPRLERSRAAKRIDDESVWSIVCFFVHRDFRGRGAMRRLVDAAVEHARAHGAKLLEAYPKDIEVAPSSNDAAFVGLLPTFLEAGFTEFARHVEARPMVRLRL